MIERYQDWPSRLDQFLREADKTELNYGEMDCCLFAANAVRAMTGFDPASRVRGKYSTERDAYDFMKKEFGDYIEATISALALEAEMTEIPVLQAQRGDVLLLNRDRRCAAGVVDLSGRRVAAYTGRVVTVPLNLAHRAWRVGNG